MEPSRLITALVCGAVWLNIAADVLSEVSATSQPNALLRAQLDVLRLQVRADRYAGSSAQADRMVGYYTSRGMPAEAFTRPALEAAARSYLVELVQRVPAPAVPRVLRNGKYRYGISPASVYELLPPQDIDAVAVFRGYLSAETPAAKSRLRQLLSEIKPTPSVTRQLIQIARKAGTDKARAAMLVVLRADCSDAGLEYLYEQLQACSESRTKLDILGVMENRAQLKAALHIEAAERTDDPQVREALFRIAKSAVLFGSEDAKQFIVHEMDSPRTENKAIAVRMVVARRHEIGDEALRKAIDAIFAEKDPNVRAKMMPALRPISGYPHIRKRLLSVLKADPSVEVRIAALDALPLYPASVPQNRRQDETLIEQLRKAVGPDAPEALQKALDAKLAEYERKSEELRQRRLRHRQKLERLRRHYMQQERKQEKQ